MNEDEWTTVRSRHTARGRSGFGTRGQSRGQHISNQFSTTSRGNGRGSNTWRSGGGHQQQQPQQGTNDDTLQHNGFSVLRNTSLSNRSDPNINRHLSSSDESESSENESVTNDAQENSLPPYHITLSVRCPFPDCLLEEPLTTSTALVDHLKLVHKLQFVNFHHVYMILESYLDYWAKKVAEKGVENVGRKEAGEEGEIYFIDPGKMPQDKELRERLQHEKLNEILAIQARERIEEARHERKCLFCKNICENRAVLFRHMFDEHNFNIGLADNLVNVNEFLEILEKKLAGLQCIYCEKVFVTSTVLRKHMRKKKHFKINARNRIYDQFYVINYLEPGMNWETFERERYDSDEDRKDDSWEDWNEIVEPDPTVCLFCELVANSPKEASLHMKQKHNFDLHGVQREMGLGFYKMIALINYIRHKTSINSCMSCNASFDTLPQLTEHMEKQNCFSKVPDLNHAFWTDPHYLFPTYENDPLLTGVEEAVGSEENSGDELLQIPENIVIVPENKKEEFAQI
ncbi:10203_t:CDS:2 [Paraglomus brasilianum]|uniref:10203_t:CDS:1 n=1 Tax=Paraglomus brasilianum TaxID=144538 RepID=A0A9N8YZE5_9GLOM|nr:10203_t:CDS:2 [Paraglomus brasilianum]